MRSLVLGNKIRQFRQRAGLSQMQLELEIDAAPGSLSRIESGQVNPTKETLLRISSSLKLNAIEIVSLFDINIRKYNQLFSNTALEMMESMNTEEVCQIAVDNILDELKLLAGFVALKEEDKLVGITLSNKDIGNLTREIISRPFSHLKLSLDRDLDNLATRAVLDKQPYISLDVKDFLVPAVNRETALLLEKVSSVKSAISIPMIIGEDCIGVIVFSKTFPDKFWMEKDELETLATQLSLSLRNVKRYEKTNYFNNTLANIT